MNKTERNDKLIGKVWVYTADSQEVQTGFLHGLALWLLIAEDLKDGGKEIIFSAKRDRIEEASHRLFLQGVRKAGIKIVE